jgi:hypothetical protein
LQEAGTDQEKANTVLLAAPTGNGPISLSGCGDLQRLKQLGDEMLDATVAVATTRDAVSRLVDGYMTYVVRNDPQGNARIREDEDEVYHQLMEHLRELDWLLHQADGIRQKLLGTSQLVRKPHTFPFQVNTDVLRRFQASWLSAMVTHWKIWAKRPEKRILRSTN